jgi:hypothetical protein
LPDDHRELEPPDPIPNSAVKWFIADGSVGFPHVRVGHCQASKLKNPVAFAAGFFFAHSFVVSNKLRPNYQSTLQLKLTI